jgi:site-specific DNA recombinase
MGPPVVRTFMEMATGRYSLDECVEVARVAGVRYRKSRNLPQKSTLHQMLRNPVYMGEFDWAGKHYVGKYEPLISRELWERVQSVLDRRSDTRHRKVTHDFAFARLIECGHCGCSMVGELKKGRYVYYHCTNAKGKATGTKCPEPYTREEVLNEKFSDLLRGLSFDEEIAEWVATALRESHEDERRHHDDAIARLQDEYARLQKRLDTMYVDRLDGRIDVESFDARSAEWRREQNRVLRDIQDHQAANQTYFEEGIRLLELARTAAKLFQGNPSGIGVVVPTCAAWAVRG